MKKYTYMDLYNKINSNQKDLFFETVLEEIFNSINLYGYNCPVCGDKVPLFLPFNNRKNVFCPNCNSFERQRLISYYFKTCTNIFSKPIKLLHFAPEQGLYELFNNSQNIDYFPADIVLNDKVKYLVDMCNIKFEDNYFDVIYNSHVLEHVKDDIKAMEELYRCVKPVSEGGYVVIMVPLSLNSKTIEDDMYNTPELRLKYYNQKDHYRKYGADFKDRLESVGFKVDEIICKNFIDGEKIKKYGLLSHETFFVAKKI